MNGSGTSDGKNKERIAGLNYFLRRGGAGQVSFWEQDFAKVCRIL